MLIEYGLETIQCLNENKKNVFVVDVCDQMAPGFSIRRICQGCLGFRGTVYRGLSLLGALGGCPEGFPLLLTDQERCVAGVEDLWPRSVYHRDAHHAVCRAGLPNALQSSPRKMKRSDPIFARLTEARRDNFR